MTSCLYACLCQAGLQRYYRQFSALGLSRPTDLSRLTMSDYPKLGVQRMEDRTSLFRLVQLVKALEEEGNDRSEDGEAERVAKGDCDIRAGRGPVRKRLDFSAFSAEPRPPRPRPDKTDAPGCSAQMDTEAGDCRVYVDAVVRRNGKMRTGEPRGDGAHRKTFVEQEAVHVRSVGYNYGLPFSTPISSRAVTESGAERIRVCVRKRPLSCAEERRREADVVTVQDGERVLIHEKKEAVDLRPYVLQHAFYFDEAFGEECTNEEVYLKTAYPLIQHVFNGGNATCFAFGQTGAGKTHTMLGSTRRSPGLYALAAQDIFAWLGRSAPDPVLIRPSGPLHVCISFFEIYCGQLYDLLDHRKRLFAREDGHHVVQIVGLREIKVESVNALLEAISSGNRDRSRGSSGVNSESSRSHALLQIQLRNHMHQMVGRISFVDLAGSERAADTRDPGRQRRLEGAEINQSLLALKECIRALDQEHTHTPFRQSKLTQVLKDSFIGNSRTCMIANISSGQLATEHTLNTLRYADRVKELKKVQKNSMGHTHVSSTKLGTPSSKHENGRSGKKEGRGFVSEVTPTGTLPFDDNLTSTPKVKVGLAECGVQREIRLDHATPVRGTLGDGAWKFRRGGEGVKRQVEEKSGEALGLLLTLGSVKEEAPATDQLVWKDDDSSNGYKARGDFTGCQAGRVCRVEGEMLGEEKTDRPQTRWREESERERHLRRYHQQLQQFDPATSFLSNGLVQQPLEDLLALYGARAEKFSDGCTDTQVPSSQKALSGNDNLADPSEIGKCVTKALDTDALTLQPVLSKRESCAEGGKGRRAQDKATGDLEFGNEEPRGCQKTLSDLRWRLDAGAEERRLDVAERVYGNGQMTKSPASVELTVGDSSEGKMEGLAQHCWKRFECGTKEERNYNGGSSGGSNGTSSNVAAEKPFSPTSSRTFVEPEELQDVATGLTVSCDVQTRRGPRGNFAELRDTANVPSASSAYAPDAGRATGRTCLNEGDDTDHCPLSEVSTESRPLGQVATAKSPGVVVVVANPVGEWPSAAVPGAVSPGSEAVVRDECLEMEFKTTAVSSPLSHDSTADSTCTNTTMGPLSVSELCVERRVATDSFLQWTSCSPCPPPNGEQGKKAEETAPCALGTLASKTYDGCPESSVEPDVQRRLQRLHREDCFMDVNGIGMIMELFPSFGYSPGCFLETVAQQGRKILDDRNSAVTIDVSNKQDQVSAIKKDPGEKLQRSQLDLSAPESPKSQTPSYGLLATTTGGQFVTKHFTRHGGYDALGETNPYPGVGPGGPTCDSSYRRKVLGERGSIQDARQTEKLWKPDLVSRPTLSQQSFRSPALRSQHTWAAAQPSGTFPHGKAMGEAQRLLVQAHCQQLEEMELLFREETLLILQTDMDFTDYVLKLGQILETKAKCVHSMQAQLLQYHAGPQDAAFGL